MTPVARLPAAPSLNCLPQFAQPSFEEMIRAFNHNQFLRLRHRRDQSLQLVPADQTDRAPR